MRLVKQRPPNVDPPGCLQLCRGPAGGGGAHVPGRGRVGRGAGRVRSLHRRPQLQAGGWQRHWCAHPSGAPSLVLRERVQQEMLLCEGRFQRACEA